MYSPCLLNSRIPKVKGIAGSHRLREVTAGAHRKINTGKQSTVHHYYYGAIKEQATTIGQRETSHLPSRAVTNRLSEVLVTHDEYHTFTGVQVV